MKRFALFLLACLTILSACGPSSPPTQPGSIIQTIAAQTAAAATLATWTVQQGGSTLEVMATSTQTETPTPTSSESLPTLTTAPLYTTTPLPPAAPVYPPITQTPEQFVVYYFGNINISNYPLTWSLLTDRFKASNNPYSAGGYQGYVNFWNTIHDVRVLAINVASRNGGYAVVVVNSIYHYNNGDLIDDVTTYSLIYDYTRATWMFDTPSTAYVPPVYVPPVYVPPTIAQTPDQFVYYYFSNINISNYPLTWSLLTDRFKSHNNPPSSGGYDGYVNFWNTVHDVQVLSVVITIQNGGYAALTVYALYNYNSGTSIYNTQTYNLVYDYVRSTWLFDSPY